MPAPVLRPMNAHDFWTDFKSQKSDKERLRACLRILQSHGLCGGLVEDKRYQDLVLSPEGD